jgi:tRNA intron endonuclease, catalytic C-terminal domain
VFLLHCCAVLPRQRFCCLYAVFAYFTALRWVVREGSKLGVDFLLYQDTAERRHSVYSVIVHDCAGGHERLQRQHAWDVSQHCKTRFADWSVRRAADDVVLLSCLVALRPFFEFSRRRRRCELNT